MVGVRRLTSWLTKRFTLKNPPQRFISYFGGGTSSAGVTVSKEAALAMALGIAMTAAGPKRSVYEDRGIRTL